VVAAGGAEGAGGALVWYDDAGLGPEVGARLTVGANVGTGPTKFVIA